MSRRNVASKKPGCTNLKICEDYLVGEAQVTHRYSEAEKYLRKIIEFDSTDWIPNAYSSLLYHFLQQWEASPIRIQKALEWGPQIPGFFALPGIAWAHLPEHFEKAEPTLHQALDEGVSKLKILNLKQNKISPQRTQRARSEISSRPLCLLW